MAEAAAVATELLQHLIRNACVNDGTAESGEEVRSADLLHDLPRGRRPRPRALRARSGPGQHRGPDRGQRPQRAHAPAHGPHRRRAGEPRRAGSRDPFGGELIDGEVWGRGAVDMLNVTASMAVAFRHLADEGFGPAAT